MMVQPNCSKRKCIHYEGVYTPEDEGEEGQVPVCKAFPKGIPYDIAYGDNDHTQPYEGDNGIQYQRK